MFDSHGGQAEKEEKLKKNEELTSCEENSGSRTYL
jgi:hypothetical protein